MATHINELFDVSVVDEKPKLIEFKLNLFENLFLEFLGTLEDFLHGHGGGKHTCLALDDAPNKLVHMVGELVVGGDELCVEEEAVHFIDTWADGKDGGEDERELLIGHGLDLEGVVHWGHVKARALLPRQDPCLLLQAYVVDAPTGDGQVLRRTGYFPPHNCFVSARLAGIVLGFMGGFCVSSIYLELKVRSLLGKQIPCTTG
jgi:hypothetical protein